MAVVIAGLGAVSCFGEGAAALEAALRAGADGLRPAGRHDIEGLTSPIAGLVPGYDHPPVDQLPDARPQDLLTHFAVLAGREALAEAALPPGARIALVLGSNLEDDPRPLHALTADVGDLLGLRGPRLTVSVACASSTVAIGLGSWLLELGAADAVLAGGADVITPRVAGGFSVLGILAAGKAAPFGLPEGMSVGEGAAFVVLAQGHTGVAVRGWGLAGDAHHPTRPAPDGAGLASAVAAALDHAGVAPAHVDYVNAHGTGTPSNDPAEAKALARVLGDVPVSGQKGLLGHAQGAAGALELVGALRLHRTGEVPGTGTAPTRPGAPLGLVREARPLPWSVAVKTSLAFGGTNAALVLGPPLDADRPRRPVYVAGAAAIGPHGTTLAELAAAPTPLAGRAPATTPVPRVDTRGVVPTTRFLLAAVHAAARDADLRLDRDTAAATGLVVGQCRVSPAANAALRASIEERGVARIGGAAFADALLVSPCGRVSEAFGLRGPLDVLDAGRASGAVAIAHAAALLAERPAVRAMVAAGVDERGDDAPAWEGAAAIVLTAAPGPVALLGWGIGATVAEAEAMALHRAGRPADRLPDPMCGGLQASAGPVGVALAVEAIRAGRIDAALLTTAQPGALTVALVLGGTRGG